MLAIAACLGAPQGHRGASSEPETPTQLHGVQASLLAPIQPDTLFKPGERCGDACRDPNAAGPVYHLAENKILPQLDSAAAAAGPGEMRDCPPLRELVPCLSGHENMADPYSSPCSACYPKALRTWPNGTIFRATKTPARRTKPIYLIIAVPAFQGSSGLEGLFSSSPSVSTMCAKSVWQCEATATLMREGVFTRSSRYLPSATNWTKVYNVYNSRELGSIWNDPTRPILMDKSPPNLAKSKSLVEFFEKNKMDYRFVAMARHPCMYGRMTDASFSLLMSYMRDVLANVPEDKIFKISYNDFVSRPDKVASRLLDWLPELVSLDINSSHLEWAGALGGGMGRVIPGTDLTYRNGVWKRTGVMSPPMDGVPAAADLEFKNGLWSLKASAGKPSHRDRLAAAARLASAAAHTQSATELFVDGLGMLGAAHRFFTRSTEAQQKAPTAQEVAEAIESGAPKVTPKAASKAPKAASSAASKAASKAAPTAASNAPNASVEPPKHVALATASADASLTFEEQEREGKRLEDLHRLEDQLEEQEREGKRLEEAYAAFQAEQTRASRAELGLKNAPSATPDSRGDRNAGDVASLVGPSERASSSEKERQGASERQSSSERQSAAQQERSFSGGEHGGRELPVLQYSQRPECSLKVIKRRYNTNDALPFV